MASCGVGVLQWNPLNTGEQDELFALASPAACGCRDKAIVSQRTDTHPRWQSEVREVDQSKLRSSRPTVPGLTGPCWAWRLSSALLGPRIRAVADPSQQPRLFDSGFLGSVYIGAVAGVAVLYFFPPELRLPGGESAPITYYDPVRLVALCLITGSASVSFLKALQARTLALLNEQKAQATEAAGKSQVDQLAQGLKGEAKAAVEAAVSEMELEASQRLAAASTQAVSETRTGDDNGAALAPKIAVAAELRRVHTELADKVAVAIEVDVEQRARVPRQAITAVAAPRDGEEEPP